MHVAALYVYPFRRPALVHRAAARGAGHSGWVHVAGDGVNPVPTRRVGTRLQLARCEGAALAPGEAVRPAG